MLLTPKPVLSWKFASLLLITALLPALSAAQASPAAPPHRVVIRAGRVLDVKSGNTLTNQTIVIEGDKIVSIGASSDAKSDASTQVIDLPNATVLPGLIDSHTHLTGDPKNSDTKASAFRSHAKRLQEPRTRASRWKPDSRRCATWAPEATATSPCATPSTMATSRARACGERTASWDHGRALRRQPACPAVPRGRTRRRRRGGRRAPQSAREHQVRRRRDQDLRYRRSHVEGGRPERLAVHTRRDEGHRRGSAPS